MLAILIATVVVLPVLPHHRVGSAAAGQVVAGAEGAAFSPDNDHVRAGIRLEFVQRVVEFVHQLLRQRVQLLRPVQRDARHAVVGAEPVDVDIVVVSHLVSPFRCVRPASITAAAFRTQAACAP